MSNLSPSISFVIPCKNEELTIGKVVADCKRYIPSANVFVCDNNSTDNTAQVAEHSGANIIYELRPGKGYAVRRLFSCVPSDIIIMVDGDDTYDLSTLGPVLQRFISGDYDAASGNRLHSLSGHSRLGHYLGNRFFSWLSSVLLGKQQYDIFSGLFILSRPFVLSFPFVSTQFELESELATHIARMDSRYFSFPVTLRERPANSTSKLNTYRDGIRILLSLFKNSFTEFPFRTLLPLSILSLVFSLLLAYLPVSQYLQQGVVSYLPRLVVSSSLIVLSTLFLLASIILQSLSRSRLEVRTFLSRLSRSYNI